ncbi:hypothetical protein ACFWVC_24080 [Streptomyces sp. NPDC058691]|uniref:hypothetical protein n=1 Tax=Streptomyces sp. NPDC058691 TaxID=3346601 RepID=UPI00364A9246
MYQRTLTRRAVVTAVAATALLGLGAAEAEATAPAAAPKFLAAKELPPHPSSPWYAGRVTQGLPDYPVFCLERGLPSRGAAYREFGTEYDTGAVQLTFKAKNSVAARDLATRLRASVRGCAARFERQNPKGEADWKDYGSIGVENGAHVYGVHTAHPDSEHGVALYGIGRDGRTVTVVKWSQMGTLKQAPVKAFKKTTKRAVAKLYG